MQQIEKQEKKKNRDFYEIRAEKIRGVIFIADWKSTLKNKYVLF